MNAREKVQFESRIKTGEKSRARLKKQWSDPEGRKKMLEGIRKNIQTNKKEIVKEQREYKKQLEEEQKASEEVTMEGLAVFY